MNVRIYKILWFLAHTGWPNKNRTFLRYHIFAATIDIIMRFVVIGALYGKSDYRVLIGNHTLAFDWCHFCWPWSTFEGHFSLDCHFHFHFSNLWQAFVSRNLPTVAEVLVVVHTVLSQECCIVYNFSVIPVCLSYLAIQAYISLVHWQMDWATVRVSDCQSVKCPLQQFQKFHLRESV